MSGRLALQRCWNHSPREAVARCPECTRFFCRECVVEHADRIICSGCLTKIQSTPAKPKRRLNFAPVARIGTAIAGLIVAWIIYFSIGRALLMVPDDYHAETLWKRALGDDLNDALDE